MEDSQRYSYCRLMATRLADNGSLGRTLGLKEHRPWMMDLSQGTSDLLHDRWHAVIWLYALPMVSLSLLLFPLLLLVAGWRKVCLLCYQMSLCCY